MDWSGILGFAIALGVISLVSWGAEKLIGHLEDSSVRDLLFSGFRPASFQIGAHRIVIATGVPNALG